MRKLLLLGVLSVVSINTVDAQSKKKVRETQEEREVKRDSIGRAIADSVSTVRDRHHSADWKSNQEYHNRDTSNSTQINR